MQDPSRERQGDNPRDRRFSRTRLEKESTYGSTSTLFKNLSTIAAAAIAILAVLGYVFIFGRELENIKDRIDRNCRFLAVDEADTRYLILEHTTSKASAAAFREIFKNAIIDTCG